MLYPFPYLFHCRTFLKMKEETLSNTMTGLGLAIFKLTPPSLWEYIESQYMLSRQSEHRTARCLRDDKAYLLAGKDHPHWHPIVRSVECERDICAALTRPAFVGSQATFCFAGRMGGVGNLSHTFCC